MLPISINGIGVRESAYMFLLGQMGVPKAEAFLIGLGTFLFVLIVNSVGGLIALNVGQKEEGITFKEPEAG